MGYINELVDTVERATSALLAVSDIAAARRPAPGKWSPKEIIGHLIDSACNNHHRFVVAQRQDDLIFPGYDQEAWVKAQCYQDEAWAELVTLWRFYNLHIARVMECASEEARLRKRVRHNLHEIAWRAVPQDQPTTLDYLMSDYVGHLKHHLRQVGTLVGPL